MQSTLHQFDFSSPRQIFPLTPEMVRQLRAETVSDQVKTTVIGRKKVSYK